ncbi:MAG: DNA-methyltransferase, partial [Dolichospermum sp.]
MVNQLYYGDNLEVLRRYIKDESVDLCYIDPPFNSKRNYNQIYNNIGAEDKAQAQAFIDTWEWDDHAIHGINEILINYHGLFTQQCIALITGLSNVLGKGSLLAYLVSMTLRITEIHRVLKPTGSFYLHCDPTASHYLKLILDAVFCSQGGEFRNEIVWCYRGAGYPKKDFGRRHDLIFRYSKGKEFTFNLDSVREEYAETTKERFRHHIGNKRGKKDFGQQSLNPLGKQPDDWWEIQPIAPSAKERLGYPTQKPEALLERIIKASSNENDIVLDAYCGCGTTVAVCQKLDRQWIGIDITYQSISLILKRLEDSFPGVLKTIK